MFGLRFLLTALCGLSAVCALGQPETAMPPTRGARRGEFSAGVTRIERGTAKEMRGVSWRPGCPVPIRDLRTIRLTHRAFWFREVAAGSTIRRMKRIDKYDGSVDASRAPDNTSAFICRWHRCAGTLLGALALRATDVDTTENPHVKGRHRAAGGRARVPRPQRCAPGMIVEGDKVTKAFCSAGFGWGGNGTGLKDYQHFEIPVG